MKSINAKFLASGLAMAAALTACGGGGGSTTPTAVTTPVVTPVVAPVAAVPTFTLASPPTSTYAVGSAEKKMFDQLNQIRIGGGFGALQQSTQIDQAAKAHADYVITNYFVGGVGSPELFKLQTNGVLGAHVELTGAAGFSGRPPRGPE